MTLNPRASASWAAPGPCSTGPGAGQQNGLLDGLVPKNSACREEEWGAVPGCAQRLKVLLGGAIINGGKASKPTDDSRVELEPR